MNDKEYNKWEAKVEKIEKDNKLLLVGRDGELFE